MKKQTYLFLFFAIIATISSCEKEKIVEVPVEKEFKWTLHPDLMFEARILYNSLATADKLFLIGNYGLYEISKSSNGQQSGPTIHYLMKGEYPYNSKLPISPLSYLEFHPGIVGFSFTQLPSYNTLVHINMLDKHPLFANFAFCFYTYSSSPVFNNQNQCLIPFSVYEPHLGQNFHSSTIHLMAANLKQHEHFDYCVDTVSTQLLELPEEHGSYPLYFLYGVEEYFFLTNQEYTLRISPQLEIQKMGGHWFTRIFKYKGSLYAFSSNELFISSDMGVSWELMGSIDPNFTWLNYYLHDGELYGTYNQQVFHIKDITDTKIEIAEIDNDGLLGNRITSLAFFDGQVYATTLSGLFSRKLEDFHDYKEVVQEKATGLKLDGGLVK